MAATVNDNAIVEEDNTVALPQVLKREVLIACFGYANFTRTLLSTAITVRLPVALRSARL